MLSLLAVIGIPGCQTGPRNFENENDRLRKLNAKLEDRVEKLTSRVENLKNELAAARRAAAAEIPEGARRPVVKRIELARFSGGIDRDDDGADDAVRLYLRTLDDRSRFIQAIGRVEVTVAAIPPGEAAQTVATASFDPEALDDAYRSGFGGAHYTLVVPVEQDVPEGIDQVTVSVSYLNLLTDGRLNLEQAVRWSGAADQKTGSEQGSPEAASDQPEQPDQPRNGSPDQSSDQAE